MRSVILSNKIFLYTAFVAVKVLRIAGLNGDFLGSFRYILARRWVGFGSFASNELAR